MKKLLILVSVLCSLHGAEQNMRVPTMLPSMQAQWPYVAAACGVAAVYVGYKSIMQYRSSDSQKDLLLFNAMAPYLYVYHVKCPPRHRVLEIAASSEAVSFLPSDLDARKDYLSKIFTDKNEELVVKALGKKEIQQEQYTGTVTSITNGNPYTVKTVEKKLGARSSEYDCIVSDIQAFDPLLFFRSIAFVTNNTNDNVLNVNFKSAEDKECEVILGVIKSGGFIKSGTIYDYRDKNKKPGALSPERILTTKEILDINIHYVEQFYTMAGGTLYKPQQKQPVPVQKQQQAKYAWYNPVRWLHRWFRS